MIDLNTLNASHVHGSFWKKANTFYKSIGMTRYINECLRFTKVTDVCTSPIVNDKGAFLDGTAWENYIITIIINGE